jgi:alpha-amylase
VKSDESFQSFVKLIFEMKRRLVVFCFILEISIKLSAAQFKNSHIIEGRAGIVHLFEWKFNDIADECQFLGEHGYGGVQVSPVHEGKDDESHSWYNRYQPVSYKIISPSGNEDEFKNMIRKCMDHQIRIYVDVILNQMTGGTGEVMGYGKSIADPTKLQYPEVPYTAEDFNEFCFIQNYTNAFEVRNCRLVELPDLNQGKENVQKQLTAFLNHLIDLGVAGFRVDAVSTKSLKNFFNKFKVCVSTLLR